MVGVLISNARVVFLGFVSISDGLLIVVSHLNCPNLGVKLQLLAFDVVDLLVDFASGHGFLDAKLVQNRLGYSPLTFLERLRRHVVEVWKKIGQVE